MVKKAWYCIVCGKQTNNRVCWECHARLSEPCPQCGKPTPTLTRAGKQAKNPTCVACTTRLKAHTRRIGTTCAACGDRYPTQSKNDHQYQVCPACQAITIPCPVCGEHMAKYRKRGNLRETCSNKCRAILHPPTPAGVEQMRRGHKRHYDRKGRVSHQNRLARGSKRYSNWRKAVFAHDDYTCQECGAHNHKGNGTTIQLHPHHIKPFATHPQLRYDVSNGTTLCTQCHHKKHEHVFIGRTRKRDPRQLSLPTVEA